MTIINYVVSTSQKLGQVQIKTKKYLDFTSLINDSIKIKKKVGYYEIKDKDWIDVGQMDKYKYFLNKKI